MIIVSCGKLISLLTANPLQINFSFSVLSRLQRAVFCGTLFVPIDHLLNRPIFIPCNRQKKKKTPRLAASVLFFITSHRTRCNVAYKASYTHTRCNQLL